ncbi:MAG: acyl-CoA thioesterase/BAAT N-terminal domain-containing protein [Thermoanaerobaculaceae bacterium]|nr:acyl-CoA thioesterase/BAAT N-terminal domain-containing protein [Thermoanaerobaculaceae bacterium]
MDGRRRTSAVLVVCLATWVGGGASGETTLRVHATPPVALYGEPFSWQVTGLRPGEPVTVTAVSTDARKVVWESQAVFEADSRGGVDLATRAPVAGGYEGADIFGLLWSMKPAQPDTGKPIG